MTNILLILVFIFTLTSCAAVDSVFFHDCISLNEADRPRDSSWSSSILIGVGGGSASSQIWAGQGPMFASITDTMQEHHDGVVLNDI